MTEEEIKNFLKKDGLFDEITIDELNKKIAGEKSTRRAVFLSLCGIFVEGVHLNTLVNSESSAGKSHLCRTIVLELFPEELYEYATKITPEAFTYWKYKEHNWTWEGKICYVEDVSQTLLDSTTFRVMCSEGTKAVVTRQQEAIEISIKGIPCFLLTTATTNPSHEILNRFNMVSLDESNKQTRNVIEKIASLHSEDLKEEINPMIKKALRELKKVKVTIPYVKYITKYFPDDLIRIRRDFTRFCDLIKSSAAFHQYRREKNGHGEIEATGYDYELARECMTAIQSESGSFGLTTRLKKAFTSCEDLYKKTGNPFTAKEIYAHDPFVQQPMWYRYLGQLVSEYKLLTITLEERENTKPIQKYTPINKIIFSLPNFEELIENKSIISKSSINSKNSISSINSGGNYTKYTKLSVSGGDREKFPVIKVNKLYNKEGDNNG